MPAGQAPYKKKDAAVAAGDRLRSKLSGFRKTVEDIGDKVQKISGPLGNRHPDKKAKGGAVKKPAAPVKKAAGGMLKKAKGRKC